MLSSGPLRHHRSNASQTRHQGFALLAVIATAVLMVTVLATLSKHSLKRALAASDAAVRFQQRWGMSSIESTLLPHARKIFEQSEKVTTENPDAFAPRQIRSIITLGGVTFDVALADEDAKANINTIYQAAGPQRANMIVTELLGPPSNLAMRLAPNPAAATFPIEPTDVENEDDSAIEIERAFRSWGEVFDESALTVVTGQQAALPQITQEITIFGGGAINLKRASDRAITAIASCVLSRAGANRLVSRYRQNPTMSAEQLIQQEAKSTTEKTRLRKMIAESSQHFSLWIDASAPPRGRMRSLAITRQADDGITVNERFAY
ncbi:hypothetical protein LOC67_02770 [Stieleria sp. JC731]|uniref:hypothetical protein n=1 Tax=Pirellulaceae TaxID=2691357 RepID=UPI001E4D7B32|nr:hypothetical protein [Stieleria sp. JC731]MCC9599469.1 hypothetical protein [Stieleria sp. JC731]